MDGLIKSGANILLADGDAYMRQSFRNALNNDGYRNIRAISRLSLLTEILNTTGADLLILDVNMPDGDATELVRDIRSGKVGRNPFIAIIMTSWRSDRDLVRRVIDSGADTLLVKPLAPAQLFSRIERIVNGRNLFVVTADYFGPDRRDRLNTVGSTRFQVPNTLKDKLEGRSIDTDSLNMEIAALMAEMNETRLISASYQIAFLISMVIIAFDEGTITSETKSQLGRIITIVEDAIPRIVETQFAGIADDFQALLQIVEKIYVRPRRADRNLVAQLKPLASAILTSTYSGGDATFALMEIATAVEDLAQRKKAQPGPELHTPEVSNLAH